MIVSLAKPAASSTVIQVLSDDALTARLPQLEAFAMRGGQAPLSRHPGWLNVLGRGLRQRVFAVEAIEGGRTRGLIPLVFVRGPLFGRFLVSLPYLNSAGVQAEDEATAVQLLDRAAALADELEVRHLEVRHEHPLEHPALAARLTSKVHMRLTLPASAGPLWEQIGGKVRNQIRKATKSGLAIAWGGLDLLPEFYAVFSQNMRDLGTPVYGRSLFEEILRQFPEQTELCVVRAGNKPAAAGLLLHGRGVAEVPSASCLRAFNTTCANMLLYWSFLERAIQRGHTLFDFGRSTIDGSTYRFKKQWGAKPHPAAWQYYERGGRGSDLRPDNPRFQRLIRIWRRLPLRVTQWLGPAIVRGIP